MAEAMMRLRNAKHMDPRHCALVDAAYFAARPQADGAARRKKARGASAPCARPHSCHPSHRHAPTQLPSSPGPHTL